MQVRPVLALPLPGGGGTVCFLNQFRAKIKLYITLICNKVYHKQKLDSFPKNIPLCWHMFWDILIWSDIFSCKGTILKLASSQKRNNVMLICIKLHYYVHHAPPPHLCVFGSGPSNTWQKYGFENKAIKFRHDCGEEWILEDWESAVFWFL